MRGNEVASFGPFHLTTAERLLLHGDTPVEIGGRALDVLIALLGRAGQIMSKSELMELVWPGVIVNEASLRVQVAALRKILIDGEGATRYIINVPGRGYSFVAAVQRSSPSDATVVVPTLIPARPESYPARQLIGRAQTVETLVSILLSRRFVTIVGAGGIGKTAVATAILHRLRQEFDDACFVDLGLLADPAEVLSTVASAIGCAIQASEPEPSILAFLADKKMLIVLDCCEHVIGVAAAFSEHLFRRVPCVHLLTTSREALRVEGENVHILMPLDSPLEDAPSAVQALAFSGVQLFMERAAASGYDAELSDADAPIAASICRRLDGNPLAIELAASRVGAYGIRGTADLLNNGGGLVLQGRRRALPRHQTLRALLDWSFELLPASEKRLFRKLSVFVGQFTLDAVQSLADESDVESPAIANAIVGLVDKSLVVVSSASGPAFFRLLDTTRAYAAAKLIESGEAEAVARMHARYFAALLRTAAEDPAFERDDAEVYAPHLGNVRKALACSFATSSELSVSVELAAFAARLFLKLSLFPECQHWCQRALNMLGETHRGTPLELGLQEAFAISSMWTRGVSEQVSVAIERGLELSEALRDGRRQIHFLAGRNIFLTRLGDFNGALAAAEEGARVAKRAGHKNERVLTEWMLGASLHFAGDQGEAFRHCVRGFRLELKSLPENDHFFGFDHRVRALVALARSLWLLGFPRRACEVALQTIRNASDSDKPISHCIALLYSIPVFFWSGDFDRAVAPVELAISEAFKYSLAPYHALGLALKGELMVANGNAALGVEILRGALKVLKVHHHHIVTPATSRALAEGLLHCGQMREALSTIDNAIARVNETSGIFWLPELLRARGEILSSLPRPDFAAAEESLSQSVLFAREQSALGWELKGAIPLARMWNAHGQADKARATLDSIYQRFTERSGSVDLVTARRLLDDMAHFSSFSPK
jgi:predicted ATPase/DNA-binding winged helix-turn-helix (wHTH) protein